MATASIKKVQEFLFVDTFGFDAVTIDANSVADVTTDVTRNGYTPVAFIPMTTQNANTVWLGFKTVDGNTARATLRNFASYAQTVTARFTVIYKKN